MADVSTLDALQAFHRELLAIREGRSTDIVVLDNGILSETFQSELQAFWNPARRSDKSRAAVQSGKIQVDNSEFTVNESFQQMALALADEIDLDELHAAKCLLDSQEDPAILGRSLLECAIIRFHQQRKYVLDALRLLLELDSIDEGNDDSGVVETIRAYVAECVSRKTGSSSTSSKRLNEQCVSAMQDIRASVQKQADRISAARTLAQDHPDTLAEELETIEFSRASLVQQHELLGVILSRSIEITQPEPKDFVEFMGIVKKVEKYDSLLVHLIPAIGAYISVFGSTEGGYDLMRVRDLDQKMFPPVDNAPWALPQLGAAVRAWWLAEYSGFYLDDPPESAIPPNTDLDEEDRQRSKQFLDSLKEGAFDFLLSVAGDVKSSDWHDSVRVGMRRWLQRKSPVLQTESVPFADFFQICLMVQLEVFVDAFISNLPDVLRKLRVEEDEQRQLSQAHEQDLDLERFLLLIAYSYEGRPEAAMTFWSDPDSNLAGFMHWASRRASTPLVTSFCEMLQAISEDEECATAAHEFLLDEGHQSSGKLRRSQSLTWPQIFKELDFFSDKIRQKPSQTPSMKYRGGKPSSDQAETEPESAMLLECYLRLITKLATESETARLFLLSPPNYNLVETLFELASSAIPARLRGCTFLALKALISRKTVEQGFAMWTNLETWVTGGYVSPAPGHHRNAQPSPLASTDRILDEISNGFDDPAAFIELLGALVSPSADSSPLNDALPFPENLGSAFRMPGIEVYVDYVLGLVFSSKANDIQDVSQVRLLRLVSLDFVLTCLSTFNEDLIVMANETNIPIDNVIKTTDLATYVRMHPFARVMEWMFNDKVMAALFNSIHQDPAEVGNASPDSPLILGILRGVEVISKVLDLQTTYLDLVRPMIKLQSNQRRHPVANAAYASFEDGLVTRLSLVVDLGNYCGVGHPDLTLACLKLLERMSSSSKITAIWAGSSQHNQRNKAVVALEANGEHINIARTFAAELTTPLEVGREAESSSYVTKVYILDFLYRCLLETPSKPSIAHLLLGFKCGVDSLSIERHGAFSSQAALFHSLLRLLLETPSGDALGLRQWLVGLKARVMRILQVLWNSSLSSSLVIGELRDNDFLFHLLLREAVIQPDLPWEGNEVAAVHFPVTDGATTLLDFLALRSMSFEYIAMELCMISQSRLPSVKRRVFDALNGHIVGDTGDTIQIPSIFDLYDFFMPGGVWDVSLPPLQFFQNLDLSVCLENDGDGNTTYNIDRVKEVLILKREETQNPGAIIAPQDLAAIEREEGMVLEFLLSTNRQKQIATQCLKVLGTWSMVLLVMAESNDFKGTSQTSFLLQALQALLPSLEAFASDRSDEALKLAELAKVLLFHIDVMESDGEDANGQAIGNLIGDKLYQLFQICLRAIGKWAGSTELRAAYYEVCYRYLTALTEQGPLSSSRPKAINAIQTYGERLINVICDDAYEADFKCQTAALVLLNALVSMGQQESNNHAVEMLNKLNFIGILVDSLRDIMQEWHEAHRTGRSEQRNYQDARLALLLQLAQNRSGAKYILHSNLFRAIELSGLFAADPELQINSENPRALEQHYELLAKVTRIIGAALVSRGSHNVMQGRKFLHDHRMLVTHTLKRSAGIGGGEANGGLDGKVEDLADAWIVVISATGFLEFENDHAPERKQQNLGLFH